MAGEEENYRAIFNRTTSGLSAKLSSRHGGTLPRGRVYDPLTQTQ
jgi:hypothetical protein